LQRATKRLKDRKKLRVDPVKLGVAAISVGIVKGTPMLDLAYEEDSKAEVDANVVMTSAGEFIEVQGTAEGKPFTRAQLDTLLGLADGGIRKLLELQQKYAEL
jgi:ribonuclease PH